MPLNAEYGINAPLKLCQNILNAYNSALSSTTTRYGSVSDLSFPFGQKTFFLPENFVSADYNRFRLYNSDLGYAVMSPLLAKTQTIVQAGGESVNHWLDSITDTLNPARSPVVLITAKKVSDVFARYNNYSEVKRAMYSESSDRDDFNKLSYAVGIDFSFPADPETSEFVEKLTFANVSPLSDIADKYIIDKIEVYATDESGALPRTKIRYAPVVFYSATTSIGVYDSRRGSYMPVSCEMLMHWEMQYPNYQQGMPAANRQPLYYDFLTNGYPILSHITGVWVCKNQSAIKSSTGKTYYVLRDYVDTGSFSGAHLIIPHNYNNGDTASASVVQRRDVFALIRGADESGNALGVFAPSSLGAATVVFDSLDDISNIFADMGVTATFDITQAQYYPIDEIDPSQIPSGYDTNPAPSVPSYPDNKTDDFAVDIGDNPAAIAVDSNIFDKTSISNLLDWFTTGDFLDTLSRLFSDPLSAIISIKYYPFDIVQHDFNRVKETTGTKIVNVVNNNVLGYQFLDGYNSRIEGGEYKYTAYYGNFADWACCRYDLYVPYLGIINISPSAVVNKTIRIYYNVDFITGNAQIFVKTYDDKYNKSGTDNGQIVYTTMQKIAVDIPITYTNFNEQNLYLATSSLRAVNSISSGATQGATNGAMTGNPIAAIAGGVMGGLGSAISSGMDFVTNFPRTEYGAKGDIGVGILSPQDAYLLVTRKILAIPADGYGNISGNPSAYYGLLKSASGYVRATSAKCDSITATGAELNEIAALLAAGIYI